jgi:hypothetical protein
MLNKGVMHMKKIFILLVVVTLAACGAPATAQPAQPTVAPPQPTATPLVVVQTVVVMVTPTAAPTDVPPPTVAPPTQSPAPTAVVENTAVSDGLSKVDDVLGAGWFMNMTRTANAFSFRCQLNKEITFSVTAMNPDITQVDFFYRIEDRTTGAIFDWQSAGRMLPNGNGNFTMVFSGEKVSADFRKPNSWFDYQFAGSNSTGVVGRSEKIERQVTYTLDCP